MKDLSPKKNELESIEIASIDEIRNLQLERMKWSLNHAYNNVPFYRAHFDKIGVHPEDLHSLSDNTTIFIKNLSTLNQSVLFKLLNLLISEFLSQVETDLLI